MLVLHPQHILFPVQQQTELPTYQWRFPKQSDKPTRIHAGLHLHNWPVLPDPYHAELHNLRDYNWPQIHEPMLYHWKLGRCSWQYDKPAWCVGLLQWQWRNSGRWREHAHNSNPHEQWFSVQLPLLLQRTQLSKYHLVLHRQTVPSLEGRLSWGDRDHWSAPHFAAAFLPWFVRRN